MESASIRAISECFIRPKNVVDESKKCFYLGSFELMQLSQCYAQVGLLFNKLPSKEGGGMNFFIERLKQSLSSTLAYFYPLAGQFVTEVDDNKHNSLIYIDCTKGPGVKFIHAAVGDEVTVNDITPARVPIILESFFELGRVSTNYDAHDQPMLIIQVTELVDGIFLGVSMNHVVMDGASFWNFFSSWSEAFQSNDDNITTISRPPICERWLPKGYERAIKIPYTHPNEFITRYQMKNDNPVSEVILRISSSSLASLKAKANADCGLTNKITSIQALSALLWRSMVRSSYDKNDDDDTTCFLISNDRSKLRPPLARDYFGNFIHPIISTIKVRELLGNSLGWVALLLHRAVGEVTDEVVREEFISWTKSPSFPKAGNLGRNTVLIGGVPRANVHDIQFGLGRAMALRSGSNKYDGRVMLHPGMRKGSFSLEICLLAHKMTSFLEDIEVTYFVDSPEHKSRL